ncbi:MAG: hypothetical protein L0H96_15270 [Humibacillus sp.]|nr:hypothetical protein [Humibacillus sp.]MDN5778262.1 hypothetical protein [Humibacillus sp.]
MQEIRRYKPSTVSRPNVPAESPTLGLTHLQFEAMLATARVSANRNDFALVAMLGLLGLRIFEACEASISDLGEEHGHRVLRVNGKGGKVVLTTLLPAVARAIERARRGNEPPAPSCAPAVAAGWTGTAPPADCTVSPRLVGSTPRGCTRTCCATPS